MTRRINLIGKHNVGKTTYVKRFESASFEHRYIPTIGVEVFDIPFQSDGTFQIYDTAGQERYQGLKEGYSIGTDSFIVMYDSCLEDTKRSILEYVVKVNYQDKPIVLCRTKCDQEFDYEDYQNDPFFDHFNILSHCFISTKTGENIYDPLNFIYSYYF